MIEAAPFNRNFSFFVEAFPFSVSTFSVGRSYQKLRELLINHSVRSPKMANLSCIHIPEEVFQSSEAYLEPS